MTRPPANQAKLTSYFLSPSDKQGENVVPEVETLSLVHLDEPQASTPSTSGSQKDPIPPAANVIGLIGSQMDIGTFDPNEKSTDQQKYDYLTNTWKPKTSFQFPRVEKKIKKKIRYLSFQNKWLDSYKWLAYSPSQNGGFCKSSKIFAPERVRGAELRVLVKKPMKNYKNATVILAEHATKAYHQLANTKPENFVQAYKSSQGNVVEQMSHHREQQALENRKGMLSLIDIIELCGRQMLSLRGHRDFGKIDQPSIFEANENEGNFRALVRFRIQSGDQDLQKFIHGSAKNVQYTSWGI
uniref:uncharacterized protein LOC120340147 n=1 Tax=Styela clava TaxID=7725 RepID=UPI00193A82ED|nr:uncharacterized protein LOC120340147 [Styela clava]